MICAGLPIFVPASEALGTLTLLCREPAAERWFGLSAAHVLYGDPPRERPGAEVQLATEGGDVTPIGRPFRGSARGRCFGFAGPALGDCGCFALPETLGVDPRRLYAGGGSAPDGRLKRGPGPAGCGLRPRPQEAVLIWGAVSGCARGQVSAVALRFFHGGEGFQVRLPEETPAARLGDSGALVTNRHGEAIGLLFSVEESGRCAGAGNVLYLDGVLLGLGLEIRR